MINERKLAWKYLCKKKSRSLATLFAIALAVFLVFVSGNLAISAFYAGKEESLKQVGNYIACLEGMKTEDIPKLEKDGAVICGLQNSECYFGEIEGKYSCQHLFFHSFEDFSKFPYYFEITEGSIPTLPGEMMLQEDFKYVLGEKLKIGDSITIDVVGINEEMINTGNEEEVNVFTKTYTLVGYYDCPEFSWMEDEMALVKDEPITLENTYKVYITCEEEGIESLESVEGFSEKETWAKELGNTYGAKVEVNDMFSAAQSKEILMVYCLILIAGAFVGGFVVIVIRNAFRISIVERTRDYGMLRCIGASKKQIRKIAFYEAFMLGVAGEIAGLVFSYLFLYLGIGIIKEIFPVLEGFKLVHRPVLIMVTCLIILGVVLFGLLEPTRQINKLNPLNALRNQKDIKKERFRGRKMPFFIRKVFGVEGEYAYKNLMRNRKKFMITTVTCVISITFFVGINAAFEYAWQIFKLNEVQYPEYNAYLDFNEEDIVSLDLVEEKLSSIEGVRNVTFVYWDYAFQNESLKRKKDESKIKTLFLFSVDESKHPIEKETVVEGSTGELEIGECYIVNLGAENENGEKVELCDVSPGDTIQLYQQETGKQKTSELKVKAVLKGHPMQVGYDMPNIIVSEECYRTLCQEQGVLYKEKAQFKFKMDESCDVSKVQEFAEANEMRLFDEMEEDREFASYMKIARFIVNVVLIIVALISSMNLFNSMESNFMLRENERKIMRTVGMSLKQYRKMILLEGMLSVMIALILGTALGFGFGYGIYSLMVLSETKLKFTVPVGSIVLSGVGLMLLTMLSSLGGMKKEAYGVPSKV